LSCARQGEVLAERQGYHREVLAERSQRQSRPDEQELHMRQSYGMRRRLPSKFDTCTEGMAVDVAGISVKEVAHYPGRSDGLPCATAVERQSTSNSRNRRRRNRMSGGVRGDGGNPERFKGHILKKTP